MLKRKVDCFDYAGTICKAMQKGILLTTKADGKVNTMTIGWGTIGIEWNKPVFVAYVRESRFTRELLDLSGEFTVNIATEGHDSQILKFCGTNSGRDTDKIQDMNLTLVDSDIVNVPGIKELPLTLECKVILRQLQNIEVLPDTSLNRFYPIDSVTAQRDAHIAYYGEIVNAYLIEE